MEIAGVLVILLKRGDILVILSILGLEAILILVFFFSSSHGERVVIELNNDPIYEFSLSRTAEAIEIAGDRGDVVIVIENGRARFLDSDCPDKTCVKTGWISRTGQAAACIPNGVLIRISGSDGTAPDLILK